MCAKKARVLSSAILIILLLGTTALAAGPVQPEAPPPLYLEGISVDVGADAPITPPGLTIDRYAPGQQGYYIVQFRGPIEQAWKDEVTALGGEILDYLPDFAFKVRMNPAQAREVTALATVARTVIFQPAYKLSPNLRFQDGVGVFTVRVERGAAYGQAVAEIASSGAEVLSREAAQADAEAAGIPIGRDGGLLVVAADPAQVRDIANVLDVAWIENYIMREKHNEYGAGGLMGANIANASGYDGSSQIVAVADTGLGGGTAATAHGDIPAARVVAIYNWPGVTDSCFQSITNDGAIDVDSGHGTHVATSVLGDGDATGRGKGTAPAARLVFQATENWVTTSQLCKLVRLPQRLLPDRHPG